MKGEHSRRGAKRIVLPRARALMWCNCGVRVCVEYAHRIAAASVLASCQLSLCLLTHARLHSALQVCRVVQVRVEGGELEWMRGVARRAGSASFLAAFDARFGSPFAGKHEWEYNQQVWGLYGVCFITRYCNKCEFVCRVLG
jgi:hypothetical protein